MTGEGERTPLATILYLLFLPLPYHYSHGLSETKAAQMKIRSRNHSTIDRVILYIFILNKKTERLGFKMEIDHLHLLILLNREIRTTIFRQRVPSINYLSHWEYPLILWRARFRSGVDLAKLATYRSAVAFKIHSVMVNVRPKMPRTA